MSLPGSFDRLREAWIESCFGFGVMALQENLVAERVRLLIKEADSAVLTGHDAGEFDQTLVVAQMPGELPAAFASRALHRIAVLERSGRGVSSATILAGRAHNGGVAAARRLIALALAEHVGGSAGPTALMIHAAAATGDAARRQLLGLVDEVLCSSQGHSVPVKLRFGSASSDKACWQS